MSAQERIRARGDGGSLRANALLSLVATGMSFLTGTVLVFVQGRFLDVALFGEIGYAITFGSLIALLPNYGFDLLVVREIAQGKYSFGETLGNVMVTKALLSLLGVLAAAGYLWVSGASAAESLAIWFYTLSFIVLSYTRTLGSLAKGRDNFVVQAISFTIQGVLVFGGTLAVILVFEPVTSAANGAVALVGRLIGLAVAALLIAPMARRRGSLRPSRAVVTELLRAGLPFAVQIALSTAYFQIDTLLIHNLLGTTETGYYQAAMRFMSGINLFASFVIGAFYPRVARAFKGDPAQSDRYYGRKMMRTLFLLGGLASVGLFILSRPLILFIYGAKMAPSIGALRVLSLVPLVRCVGSGYGILLISIHRQRVQVYAAAVATSMSVALNLWLLPQFGYYASAWINLTVNVVILAIYSAVVVPSMGATLLETNLREIRKDALAILALPSQIIQRLRRKAHN